MAATGKKRKFSENAGAEVIDLAGVDTEGEDELVNESFYKRHV